MTEHAYILGFPGGSVAQNPPASAGRCRKLGFDIWVGTILLNGNPFQSAFLPGESHGQRSLAVRVRHELATKERESLL